MVVLFQTEGDLIGRPMSRVGNLSEEVTSRDLEQFMQFFPKRDGLVAFQEVV